MGLYSDVCRLSVALRIQLARPQRRIVDDIHSVTADFAVHLACDFLLDEVGRLSSWLAYAGDLLQLFLAVAFLMIVLFACGYLFRVFVSRLTFIYFGCLLWQDF